MQNNVTSRLTTEDRSIFGLTWAWDNLSEEEAEQMKKNILERRKKPDRLDEIHQDY